MARSARPASRPSASHSSRCSPSTTAIGTTPRCSPRVRSHRSSATTWSRDAACALVYAVSALLRAQRDRVERARDDLERAAALLALVDHVPWYDVEVRIVVARAALRLGDVARARTVLAEAERRLPRAGEAVLLGSWVDDLRSQIEAFALTALIGPSSLTTAELRVLRLLPTHLSFREIGRRLHVSANTVKTHAHAIYRKLDVRSRSAAVARAHETGLLDHDARRPAKEDTP